MQTEITRYWRASDLGDVEGLYAKYFTYSFAKHTHTGFAIGVIDAGAERFFYRGSTYEALPDSLVLLNPEEIHTGAGVDKRGWTFRMFYVDPKLLQRIANELADGHSDYPFFHKPVVSDCELAARVRHLHRVLETSGDLLERQSLFCSTFAHLIQRQGTSGAMRWKTFQDPRAISGARDYLFSHLRENISLDTLSKLSHLSPYHFLRTFQKHAGMPPHAYLTQLRVTRSKSLLRAGRQISEVALETGFFDQSHFAKHFKRMVGITPGKYIKAVRPDSSFRSPLKQQ